MKKLMFCLVLLFVSMPLLAGMMGIGVGVHGGVEMMVPDGEDTEIFPAIGGALDFSLPGIPIGLRGDFEYAWKTIDDVKVTDIIILLGPQFNLVLPGAPMSFYVGAGGQLAMSSYDYPGAEGATDFGFLAYAGANYSMGMIGIFAEVGYGMIFSEDEEMEIPNLTNIPIRGGIKFSL